tara:strand:- start:468 stop:659 length:192 start_codon:yes stop_codon:yes gene_type:complete
LGVAVTGMAEPGFNDRLFVSEREGQILALRVQALQPFHRNQPVDPLQLQSKNAGQIKASFGFL